MIYLKFIRFLLPLVFTMIVQELGTQVLNGGMARMPRAMETLASYGLAWGLVTFLTWPLFQAREMGLVLVDSRSALKKVRLVVLVSGLSLSGVLAVLALSPLGTWVIEVLHGIEGSLGAVTLEALFWLIPVPLLRGFIRFQTGMLIRIRRTGVVSGATVANIGASIATTFALLPADFVRTKPICLPLLVTYAGTLIELSIILWGNRRYVHRALDERGRALSYTYILRFFWPLALTMAIQGLSRPLINLFVSRSAGGAEALAVLTVVYALGHLPYGWLNDLRSLPTAFAEHSGHDRGAGGAQHILAYVRRFALGCGLAVFATMVTLYWTPLREYILHTLIGIDDALAVHATAPLILFSFFPLPVMVRAYLHGVGLVEHRTRALAPSGPARIGAILVTLAILSGTEMHGATRAVASLLSGFIAETIVVWLGVRGPQILQTWRPDPKGVTDL